MLMRLVLSFAVIVSAHYLVVFVLLVAFYYKILQRIKRMRSQGWPGRGTVFQTKRVHFRKF